MTTKQIDLIERAHELARSGEFEFVYQIERQLITEGYARVETTFGHSRELRHALRDCIKAKGNNKDAEKRIGGKRRRPTRPAS